MGKNKRKQANKQQHLTNRQRKREEAQQRALYQKKAQRRKYGDAEWRSDLRKFNAQLSVQGLKVKDVAGDGNCMFRAICDQLEGTPHNFAHYRRTITAYMTDNRQEFEPYFIGEDENVRTFTDYLNMMRRDGSWGGNLELQAASMALGVNIVVHQLEQARWEVVNYRTANARAIALSYHTGDHYASVRALDGSRATVQAVNASTNGSQWSDYTDYARTSTASTSTSSYHVEDSNEPNWQEDLVMNATGATLEEARDALLENFKDTDAAVNYLLMLKFSLEDSVDPLNFATSDENFAKAGDSIPSVESHSITDYNVDQNKQNKQNNINKKNKKVNDWAIAQRRGKQQLTAEEKLAKANAKAPQQHVSNSNRKRLMAREKKKQSQQTKATQSKDPNNMYSVLENGSEDAAPIDEQYQPKLVTQQSLAI